MRVYLALARLFGQQQAGGPAISFSFVGAAAAICIFFASSLLEIRKGLGLSQDGTI
jgi:hypothetical protein